MAALAILNPRRKRATAKRKMKRPMTAKQLRYFGPRKVKRAAAARSAKAPAKSKVIIVTGNPKGKTVAKRKRRHSKKTFRANPRKASRRRFNRNPRVLGASFLRNTLVPAAIGAGGAVAVDALLAALPLPAFFKTGPMLAATKIALALGVGVAVGAITTKEAGEEAAAGGVIVALYGLGRGLAAQHFPSVPLARYIPNGPNGTMRRYVPMKGNPRQFARPGGRGIGYTGPARQMAPIGRGTLRGMMG